ESTKRGDADQQIEFVLLVLQIRHVGIAEQGDGQSRTQNQGCEEELEVIHQQQRRYLLRSERLHDDQTQQRQQQPQRRNQTAGYMAAAYRDRQHGDHRRQGHQDHGEQQQELIGCHWLASSRSSSTGSVNSRKD